MDQVHLHCLQSTSDDCRVWHVTVFWNEVLDFDHRVVAYCALKLKLMQLDGLHTRDPNLYEAAHIS